MYLLEPLRDLYARFERPISSFSLIFGFVFDALTLKRVDTLWENVWIFGHIVVVGVFIFLIHVQEGSSGDEHDASKAYFWYVNILQFFFGGLLSTYLVFYFRSGDIFTAWPFIVILLLAFVANESLKRHYVRLSFQISLFFLSIYSFAIFLLPVVLHKIGVMIFLLSGLVSLCFISIFVLVLLHFAKGRWAKQKHDNKKAIFLPILFIFILINFLYFTNLIPPIPLSLKDAGVYHSIKRNTEGNYEYSFEDYGWQKYFILYEDFHGPLDGTVYVYSAIFSPRGLNTTILHEWQYYDESVGGWVTKTIVNLSLIGGREGGFRTYSARSSMLAGKWRVNVKTQRGETIGRVRFKMVPSATVPEVNVGVKS